jgi:hypothetical protein
MTLKVINLVFFVFMVVMNYLANAIPLNNKTTGQLSDEYQNLFVPSGATFSIWGVIYLMLLVFIVLQFFDSNKELVKQIGWAFSISCVFNGLWIVAWHYQYLPISLVIMIGLLVSLITINYGLKGNPNGFIKAAFGIYFGWISIATIANVTALLVSYEWGSFGLSNQVWAIIMISIGTIIASLTVIRINNPFVGLAVLWAFLGIINKQTNLNPSIVVVSILGIAIVGIATLLIFLKFSPLWKS